MNNWHIKIADCNEAQKERLKRVYGYVADLDEYFGISQSGNVNFWSSDPGGELITPDEAFERLGLTAKPELQGVDWSIVYPEYNWLAQNKGSGTIDFHHVKPTGSNYAILETRPKPKYTPEQIEAVKDFDAWVSRRHKLSGEFNWWLKEVSND